MAFNGEPDGALPYPIIADDKRELSVQMGMLDPDERDKDGIPLTARSVRQLLSARVVRHVSRGQLCPFNFPHVIRRSKHSSVYVKSSS